MPRCEGRPAGPCPNKINDSTVKWSICDLFLCPECLEFRVPSRTPSDNSSSPSIGSDDKGRAVPDHPVRCELLCFIQQKTLSMTVDHIAQLCSDFYTKDEILSARTLMGSIVSNQRLPRRQGANATRATVDDLIKVCLDPNIKLPSFFAVDLSRLPPVDASHCDVAALLKEIQALRAEVRQIAALREEFDKFKVQASHLGHLSGIADEVQSLRTEVHSYIGPSRADSVAVDDTHFPPLISVTNGDHSRNIPRSSSAQQYSSLAQDLRQSGMKEGARPARKRTALKSVSGTSASNTRIKSVKTKRTVDLFVSRLCPETENSEVVHCVLDIVGNSGISDADIVCERLKPRIENVYSSFHVALKVESSIMMSIIGDLMKADSWPAGILVRRFFKAKHDES